ncbi:MAG: helix-turn-helix domain-containing protein [Pseudonocardiaceae bacterium]
MSTNSGWLSSRSGTPFELDTGLLSEVLREHRRAHGISQADLAQLLNMDQSYVSKIETGQRHVRDLEVLLGIAHELSIPPRRLGIADEMLRPLPAPSTAVLVGVPDIVQRSQEDWCRRRRDLNRRRNRLAREAIRLYRRDFHIGGAPFIAPPAWMPTAPVRLESVHLEWEDNATGIEVDGTEPEAAAVLPLRAPGRRFDRYTSAIRYLDRPSLFENRPSYRLLEVDMSPSESRLSCGLATYFDKLDLSEGIAHELAVSDSGKNTNTHAPPDWAELPLRALIGDPFDLRRRAVMPAIETLTLRRDRRTGAGTFLLHWRDPAKVATAAGIYGLIPAGEFQPSSIASRDRENDFDLWRNMVREYSEELLGDPERDGSQGQPLDYDNWPLYRSLESARQDERVRAYCLGVGLDTLTLTATVLTVVVMDGDVFDSLFGDTVRINSEGVLVATAESSKVSDGVPFTEANVRRLLADEPLASPAACILSRSWRFRSGLLPQQGSC